MYSPPRTMARLPTLFLTSSASGVRSATACAPARSCAGVMFGSGMQATYGKHLRRTVVSDADKVRREAAAEVEQENAEAEAAAAQARAEQAEQAREAAEDEQARQAKVHAEHDA